ncbi:M23 family metallopeptidase [Acidimicrobiia bacterium EGI L10123]|uniref:hypothetical protein n=1 Tax=Salinilacustrithrix flava TaxID=2957203 RepID=UPI003D7C17E3|nr:M23 family metallopeptidase [Acidimicrobiia bacterium EGI L10123]
MPEDPLPTRTPADPPTARRRRSRRQGLLAAGLTGLVVTAPPSGASVRDAASATIELPADEDPDPAPLFGVDLSSLLTIAHRAAAAGDLVSAVLEGPSAVARWDGVEVLTDGDTTEFVGFHESNSTEALPLDSTRPIAASHHHGAAVPITGEAEGQVIVLPTRQRAAGPMTAIDLAVDADAGVTAPVDGVVVEVAPIQYRGSDHKITIRPHANPDVEVSIIHIVDPLVVAGDHVRGGETLVAAGPRQLGFESQVDRFTEAARGAAAPHVHVEMRATEPNAA